METTDGKSRTAHILLTVASFVVVVAGIKAAAVIVVPFLLALFISIVCSSPLFWLKGRGLSTWLAILIVILGIILAGYIIAALLGSSIDDFSRNLPEYSTKLNEQYGSMITWLESRGIDMSRFELVEMMDPDKAMQLVAMLFNGLGDVLANGMLILLTVIFILMEASGFPGKLKTIFRDPDRSLAQMGRITENVKHYLAIKTMTSLMTGLLVAVFLFIMRIDYPLLWGLLVFLLNYVPNIGSIIAALPAILQALIQFGPGRALGVAIGYVVINMLIGNFIEPRFMGKGLGLSTLVVFLSLIFWGWVLGPVGMLLSVVLTVTVKIGLESREDTRWMAILLGSGVSGPAETGIEEPGR
ncbi:MAG: AI-2E family transporter [Bacteroidales bacterium]|nr:AI-2E family transporter [Candidatus Latescibacterota bacterium]